MTLWLSPVIQAKQWKLTFDHVVFVYRCLSAHVRLLNAGLWKFCLGSSTSCVEVSHESRVAGSLNRSLKDFCGVHQASNDRPSLQVGTGRHFLTGTQSGPRVEVEALPEKTSERCGESASCHGKLLKMVHENSCFTRTEIS